jgi:hypothetical protein
MATGWRWGMGMAGDIFYLKTSIAKSCSDNGVRMKYEYEALEEYWRENRSILSKTRPIAIPTTGNNTIHREPSIMTMCRRSNLGQN